MIRTHSEVGFPLGRFYLSLTMAASHDPKDVDFVGDERPDVSWLVNVEHPEHTGDRETIIKSGIETEEYTIAGYHITPITHDGLTRWDLYPALEAEFGDAVDEEFVGQYGYARHVIHSYI